MKPTTTCGAPASGPPENTEFFFLKAWQIKTFENWPAKIQWWMYFCFQLSVIPFRKIDVSMQPLLWETSTFFLKRKKFYKQNENIFLINRSYHCQSCGRKLTLNLSLRSEMNSQNPREKENAEEKTQPWATSATSRAATDQRASRREHRRSDHWTILRWLRFLSFLFHLFSLDEPADWSACTAPA